MQDFLSFVICSLITVIGNAFLTALTAEIIYNTRFRVRLITVYSVTYIFVLGMIVAFSDYVLIRFSPNLAMTFRTFFCAVAAIILLKCVFKLKLANCITCEFFFLLFLAIGNVVMSLIFKTLGIDTSNIKMSLFYIIVGIVIIDSVVLIILAIIKSFRMFSCFNTEIKSKAYKTNILYICLVFAILILNFNYYEKYAKLTDILTLLISVLLLIVFLLLSLFNTNTFFKLETKSQELEYQLFYNKALDAIIKDLRRFKHNYNNILSVFGGYIKTKKWDEVERYYTEICGDISKVSFLDNLSMANIKNAGILWLIMSKYENARELKVDFRVVTEGVIGEIGMKMSEFCEIMGILLDNAIEAASASERKVVELFIRKIDGSISFVIENAVLEKVNVAKLYEEGYSTKGEGRGLGLYILKRIVSKYENVILNTQAEETRFKQELIINP
ncbi:MAG TPA: GHKL domain-containing protein [Acetivibrio sp.]|nr:GHKL domain-containing protein [Acetivibrio sp.]